MAPHPHRESSPPMDGQFGLWLLVMVRACRRVWARRSRRWDRVTSSSSRGSVGRRGRQWDPIVLVLGANEFAGRYGQDEAGGGISPPRPRCRRACNTSPSSSPSCLPSVSCPASFWGGWHVRVCGRIPVRVRISVGWRAHSPGHVCRVAP
jgi:hypothetical protein